MKHANPEPDLDWLHTAALQPDVRMRTAAEQRQAQLTKPPGALGRLEDVAIALAALQGTEQPSVERVHIAVFAGDHGVTAEGISAFPQAVTAEMVKNFAAGGAAICAAAKAIDATLEVINLGTAFDTGTIAGVTDHHLGPGTANFVTEPAMREPQLARALAAGQQVIAHARDQHTQLFIGGEMGIGNTTSAAAIACALLDAAPQQLAGPGTGLDANGVSHKRGVIRCALACHRDHLDEPLDVLRRLGGFEIAALTGSYIACAQFGIPALVDGFISSVAALIALRLRPDIAPWLIYAHTSAEPGHRRVLDAIAARPLLDLGMRLGEGSGAAVAVPLLRMACALHNGMATFTEAGVSNAER